MSTPTFPRFLLRELAFTGPRVPDAGLTFVDGLNVIWGASNTGKSFTVKALNFMSGGGKPLPKFEESNGYDRAWLELTLPHAGTVTLARSLSKGGFSLYRSGDRVGTTAASNETLALKHDAKNGSLSAFLLSELDIAGPVEIVAAKAGSKHAFTFRHFAHYLYTEETDMMAEWSPVSIAAKSSDAFNKNVLKYLLTGIDGSAVVPGSSADAQRSVNSGKIELLGELIGVAERELARRFPDADGLEGQDETLGSALSGLEDALRTRQSDIDVLRLERRRVFDAALAADERGDEISIMVGRFESLLAIYESDTARLEALEEGGAALLAGARRTCPLCGADPAHQVETHSHDQIEATRAAARAEIAKILTERRELTSTVASLQAEREGLGITSRRLRAEVESIEGKLAEALPMEANGRQRYEHLSDARETVRQGLALKDRIADFAERMSQLERFRPRKPADDVDIGLDGITGHAFAKTIQGILRAWRFPGEPDVSFDLGTHDILLNGKSRDSNGKGVRALMNAAFKIGVLDLCRQTGLPHPGVLVLDSPLLSYRDAVRSKHGGLSEDEKVIRRAGVHEHFYRYLILEAERTQFIVLENNEPPIDLGPKASVTTFVGNEGDGPRKGLF